MTEAVIVALVSFAGTILGSLIGVITSNKLTQYRIDKLEEAVNNLAKEQTRINDLETHNQIQDEKIKNLERLAGV